MLREGKGEWQLWTGAKNQHANKTKGETEVRPEMFNAHCLRVKCRMGGWHSLGGGKGVQAGTGCVGGTAAPALDRGDFFVCLFYFFSVFFCLIFIFGVYISLLTRRVSAKERSGRADGG